MNDHEKALLDAYERGYAKGAADEAQRHFHFQSWLPTATFTPPIDPEAVKKAWEDGVKAQGESGTRVIWRNGCGAVIALLFALAISTPAHAAPPLFAPAESPLFARQTRCIVETPRQMPTTTEDSQPDGIDRDTPPLVIGAWKDPETSRVIIANYAEALRIAQSSNRPLVVMVRMAHVDRDLVSQAAPPDAVLTIVEDDQRFPAKGVYRYEPVAKGRDGKVQMVRVSAPRELLFFTAGWCAACKRVEPLARDAGARMVDIDKEPATAKQYGVEKGIPMLVILEDGKEVRRAVGVDRVRAYFRGAQ